MIENNVITDTELLRKCLVFYNAIGGDYDIQELDYKNVANTPGTHTVPVSAISFFDVEGAPLYGDSNKNENIKYDTTAIMISVTVESKNAQTDDK